MRRSLFLLVLASSILGCLVSRKTSNPVGDCTRQCVVPCSSSFIGDSRFLDSSFPRFLVPRSSAIVPCSVSFRRLLSQQCVDFLFPCFCLDPSFPCRCSRLRCFFHSQYSEKPSAQSSSRKLGQLKGKRRTRNQGNLVGIIVVLTDSTLGI